MNPLQIASRRPELHRSLLTLAGILVALSGWRPVTAVSAPLTTLDYRVRGAQLQITPAALAVPKNIAGSVATTLTGPPPPGSYIEAFLRGPSFPARRLVGAPGQPLLLPPLNLVGDYSLDGIRLAEGTTNDTLLEGTPSSVPVQVFDEILVSRVTSRPLSLDEIQEKGIVIDEKNFRAIEFEVGFVLDGVTIPVRFPIVTPKFRQTTEIIPAAELEERLAEAERINNELSEGVKLPPELEVARPNIQIRPVNFQLTAGFKEDLTLKIPPIPALLVIPGNVGFLHQFFSVQIFTENAAPGASGLSVHSITAELLLPAGPDRVPGTFDAPGDDPIRFARVGPNAEIRNIVPVRALGADGQPDTTDDADRLQPGQGGQGEFLVEGLQEGLHVMDLTLKAKLDGLAAGPVEIEGKAAGSVLVSNPKFSLSFSHPRSVRAGESYDAFVTLLNTSQTIANLVSVSLNPLNITGGVLRSAERVELGTLRPGESGTAAFRILSQQTGEITFTNITTSDDSLAGRIRLRVGVDERGVQLSKNTLLLPDLVNELPPDVVAAANRVLGQALSVSTAPQLPPGVLRVPNSFVKTMVLQLAEAGQRARYGESLARVLPDLLLDWQGGRDFADGWDQIVRTTDAGRAWREALMRAMEDVDPAADDPVSRMVLRGRDLAGRGETWCLAAVSRGVFQEGLGLVRSASELNLLKTEQQRAGVSSSTLPKAVGYGGREGAWLASQVPGTFEWKFAEGVAGQIQMSVLKIASDGTAREIVWNLAGLIAGACARYDAGATGADLRVDDNCDGTVDRTVTGTETLFTELDPQVLLVKQDPELHVGRPQKFCPQPTTRNDRNEIVLIRNYGNILALLFSKPMTQTTAATATAYTLDGANEAAFVQVQPGGRVALLTLRRPIGGFIPRTLSLGAGITDARGLAVTPISVPVQTRLVEGVTARGRVLRADGSAVPGVPVTLTYNDQAISRGECVGVDVRTAQLLTAADGGFAFDFLVGGIGYTFSTTDTSGLANNDAINLILQSTTDGGVAADRLSELGTSLVGDRLITGDQALREAFGVANFSTAIALAEGLDRALVRDLAGPTRIGTEAVYALLFRGRSAVTGQVIDADGTTPINGAAVNLFPDPDSRELGRGVLTDSNGRFAFLGVPLGVISVEATSPTGQTRTVSALLDIAGGTREISIVLGDAVPVLTGLQGRVTEPDGTPHGGASVFVTSLGSVRAAVKSDDDGFWSASGIVAGPCNVVAISFDGRRKGERHNVAAAAGSINTVNVVLQARATVRGLVQFANGDPVAGALVGGGEVLVTTDALGAFTLPGVPTGPRAIDAGIRADAANADPRRHFARIGSATLDVQAGDDNFVVIRFTPAGRIVGQILDELGQPVGNTDVAIPLSEDEESGSFIWVDTDSAGRFIFDDMGLGNYDLSSPAPPHETFNLLEGLSGLRGGNKGEIQAALGAAFAALADARNNEGANFSPGRWGFTRGVKLERDGQTVATTVRYLVKAKLSGVVKNGQGAPIGARVLLTGVGPKPNGRPTMRRKGELDSDPALGTFLFDGVAFVGDYGLQAASPFFPVVVSASGRTTQADPVVEDILLQFPLISETNGSLSGQVLNPDGSPAGANIKVQISFGPNFIIRTDAGGRFATTQGTFTLPATGYTVTVTDEATGATAQTSASVTAGQDNSVTVRLLGRGQAIVRVLKADGTPAPGATVEIQGANFPGGRFDGSTNASGEVVFSNVFEGSYAACASLNIGGSRVAGRAGLNVPFGGSGEATITLGGTATVSGQFVGTNGVTGIPFATVRLGGLAVVPADADGRFEMLDVPLGTHRITATDPTTGRSGFATVDLAVAGETREVRIVETALGTVFGLVINGLGTGPVPNAEVKLRLDDAFASNRDRTVTSGPDGSYSIAGIPAGSFTVSAFDRLSGLRSEARATLATTGGQLEVNLTLEAIAHLTVQVFEPDGTTPATLATVSMGGFNPDTDANGRVRFENVKVIAPTVPPSAPYHVFAISSRVGSTRSFGFSAFNPTVRGAEETITVTLRGVGAVQGQVFLGDGVTPAPGAVVTIEIASVQVDPTTSASSPFGGEKETIDADPQGRFLFTNYPVGPLKLSAFSQALGAQADVTIASDGQTVTQNLVLTSSGTVTGRLVRADGTTPAEGGDVGVTFTSASNALGSFVARVGADGRFSFAPVTLGNFSLSASLIAVNGLAKGDGTLTTNGQTNDVGDLVLDEALPLVVATVPANTADGADINASIEVLFSEAMDPASIDPTGIFVRKSTGGPPLPATVSLVAPAGESARRLALIDPAQPLESESTYQIIVVDGELVDAQGSVINRGPRDLVGRILPALFSASFTTRDQRPPLLLSFTPENGAEGVDGRTPVRLSFDEAIQPGAVITLSGPGGIVAGTTSLGVNNLVLTFVPSFGLPPNGTFTVNVSGVKDVAGNDLVDQPRTTTFSTLDTSAPVLSALRIKNNATPVANTTITLEAVPAAAEPGMRVRFSADFTDLGTTPAGGLEFPFTLPAQGTVVFGAIAIDRFGNEGQVALLTVPVQENQPPVVTFTRLNPTTGPAFSGSSFSVRVNVTDDGAVTDFRAAATGAATAPLQTNSNGAPIVVQGVVPANAVPGTKIAIVAQASDNSGRVTGEQRFEIDVADGTAPSVAFISPAANATADPAVPFTVTIDTTDNSGDATLEVTLSGGATGTQSVEVDGTPNVAQRSILTFDLSTASQLGGTFTATARATDAAARVGIASRTFRFPDRRAPQLATFVPAAGAVQQSLWTEVVLTFDEAMKLDTFTSANIEFPGAFTVTESGGQTIFTLRAGSALPSGQLQSIRLKPGLTDAAGNPWQDAGGTPVPPEGKLISFTTAAFTATTPAPNTKVVPGQTIVASADFQSGLGADQFAFQTLLGPEALVSPSANRAEAQVSIDLLASGTETLFIVARKTGRPAFTLPGISLDVRPRGGDDDGDGITNGQEADAGLDPFRDDRQDDNDGDGRNNAQEVLAGTDPNDPDSDDDGLNDGAEFIAGTNPLVPDSDGDGLRDGTEAAFSANPVLADTDGDTLNDGFEVGVGRLSIVAGSFTWTQAKADAETRGGHLLTVTSTAEQAGLEAVLPTAAASGGWIGLSDQFIEGAFAWVTGEPAALLRFGPGEPNNSNNEDFIHLRGDGLWNDNSGGATLPYILELGFFTNPAQADSDGDGVADAVDSFPGQQNRAPVAGNDSFSLNAGEPRNIDILAELLDDDSDPDGPPIAFAGFTQPAVGGAVTQPNATTLLFTPAGGFSGTTSFGYTITDPNGLTATATVTMSTGANTRPLAGESGVNVAGLVHSYDLNGSLADFFGGPSLVSAGGTLSPTEYLFQPNQGLSLSGAAIPADEYSIAASFIFDAVNGFRRIADFKALTTDNGLYAENGTMRFFGSTGNSAVVFSAGTPVHVVFTRNAATQQFVGYVDGVQEISFTDSSQQATLSAADRVLHLFRDNGGEASSGRADFVRIFNRALDGSEVAELFQNGGLRGQVATTAQDTAILIPLAGTDPDGGPLTARILSLPGNGRLFQFNGGVAGAEITAVPANVTDAQRRVVYQPNAGFVGDDAFLFSMFDGSLESFPAQMRLHVVPVLAPASDDLWDVSQGTTVTTTSGTAPSLPATNIFGANFGSGGEQGNTLFADDKPAGFAHFVEWETPGFVRLEGARLFATNDGGSGRRGFTEMRLFARLGATEAFTLIESFRPGANPYFAPVRAVLEFAPFVGKQFRAEFDQFNSGVGFDGPRIEELDAIGETVVLVPTPAEVTLQNATSDRTQGGFTPVQLIDGNVVGGQHGWAGDVGGTPPMTAVFETAGNIGATVDTEFTFELPQPFGGQHFIGNFRLSATTDSRDNFADGLVNGGDITANWTVLDVIEVTSTGGETLSVLPDKSILIGGTMPATTSYTVRAKGISGGVTGFRLELLEHPSLPNNGPGRVGHGNWVLAEFSVEVDGATLVPNRAPRVVADSGETIQGIAFTTVNVLANDNDFEDDAISLLDFTQPAAGTGTVAPNGDGTFTYTPPAAFNGETSFTYRATDTLQNSAPATVTITVRPSLERVWANAAGGNWSVAANWVNGLVPGPDDIAVIDLDGTYTVTVDGDVTISQLRLGGPSGAQTLDLNGRTLVIRGAGTVGPRGKLAIRGDGRLTLQNAALLTVGGTFDFEAGTLTAGGRVIIDTAGVGNFTTASGKFIDDVLENRGTVNYTGTGLLFGRDGPDLNARIENAAGATFIVDGEGDFAQNHGSANYRIDNAGTLIKRGVGTTTVVNSPVFFSSTGTVEIEAGTLQFNTNASLAGTVSGAGQVFFAGGSHTLAAGLTFNPATFAFSNVNLTIGAGVAPQLTALDINASTVAFADSRSLQTLTIRSDGRLTMQNNSVMTVTGTFNWETGTLSSGSRLIVDPGAVANFTTANGKFIDDVLENRGTVNYTGTGLLFGRDGPDLNARIENAAGATFIVDGEGDFAQNHGSANYRIDNAGTFIKRGAGTTTVVNNPIFFATTGGLQIESGVLQFNFSTSLAGTITGASNIGFAGGTHTLPAGTSFDASNLSLTGTTLSLGAGVAPQLATVDINGSTLSVTDSRSLADLTIRGDGRLTMQNDSSMTITGTFTFEQGTLTAGGRLIIAPGAVGNLTTGNGKFIDNVLENRGTTNYTGTGVIFGRDTPNLSARIENAGGGTFIVEGEGDFSQNHGSANYRIDNAGTFIKRGAGTTTVVNNPIFFATTGGLQIESGVLQFNFSTSLAGTITGASNIGFAGGTHTLPAGTSFDASNLSLTGTTLSLGAGVAPQLATVDINGSTLSVTDSRSLADLTIRGDGRLTMQNDSSMTITGTFTFEQGTLTAGGRLIIAPGAVGNLTTGNGKFIDNVLENRGTTNYTGTGVIFGRDTPNLSARIENAGGGTFIVEGEGDFSQNHGSANYRIDNAGTFIKRGAGTTTVVNNPIFFATTGGLQIESGVLQFNFSTSLAGTITGASNIGFAGGTHTLPAGTSFDASNLSLTGTTLSLGAGVAPQLATVDINGSTLSVTDSRSLADLTIRGDGRLTMQNDSSMTITGTFTFEQGTLTAGGRLIIAPGAVGNLTTGNGKFIDNVLENRGTTNYTGTGVIFGRDTPNLSARIENAGGGTFIVEGEGDFSQNHGSANYRIDNAGTFIKRGAGTTTAVNNPIVLNTAGTVQLDAGTLSITGGFTQDGILRGTGTVAATFSNNGTVRPDPLPGGLIFEGNVTQTGNSRIELTLAGRDPSKVHASLTVTGSLTLAGTLAVNLAFPFNENAAETFDVLRYGSRSGDFTATEALANNLGYTFSRAFTSSALQLTVTQKGDVPPPPAPSGLPSGFPQWAQLHLAGQPDALQSAGADADRDGVVNLLEYALGGNPLDATPGVAAPEMMLIRKGATLRPALRYRRRSAANDLTYIVEVSTDLSVWRANEPQNLVTQIVKIEPDTAETGWEFVTEAVLSASPGPTFLRLNVAATLQPAEAFSKPAKDEAWKLRSRSGSLESGGAHQWWRSAHKPK